VINFIKFLWNIYGFIKDNSWIFFLGLIIFIIIFLIVKNCYNWGDSKHTFQPFIITLAITLIIFAITLSMAIQTDKKVDILMGKIGLGTPGNEELAINKAILSKKITPDGTIVFWTKLNRPKGNYQRGYLFDIADSYVKNRMSLLVDEEGFLMWRIVDNDYNIHILRADVNEFLNDTKFFIVLTWNTTGELVMYINGQPVNKIKLDKLKLDIKSTDMYFGSDIDGRNNINMNLPKVTNYS